MATTEPESLRRSSTASTTHSTLSNPSSPQSHESRLKRVINTIRAALDREQQALFHGDETTRHERRKSWINEHLNKLRVHDEQDRQRVTEELKKEGGEESDAKVGYSPAQQAQKLEQLNENGMESHQAWGWPGLGSYGDSQQPEPQAKTTRQKSAQLEPRAEAAAFEAIDNAAEGESFGWPGVGPWPASKPSEAPKS